jgi:hypothetical protein
MMLDLEEDDEQGLGGALGSEAQSGEVIQGKNDNYRITNSTPIGSGTSGTVYAGVGVRTGQQVAVKIIDRCVECGAALRCAWQVLGTAAV